MQPGLPRPTSPTSRPAYWSPAANPGSADQIGISAALVAASFLAKSNELLNAASEASSLARSGLLACKHPCANPSPAPRMAKLYFSYAAMNAGKSTLLLQAAYNYRERGMRPLLYTSALYAEDGVGLISSRIGIAEPAELYSSDDDLYQAVRDHMDEAKVDCVFVDEAQFLTPDQVWQLARVSDRLKIPVMCFGLRTDFRGKLFPGSMQLLAIADVLREIRTICECGAKATMVVRQDISGRVLTDGEQVSIEKSVYISLCRKHWEEAVGRWPVKGPDHDH
jgi:thymidine kinase